MNLSTNQAAQFTPQVNASSQKLIPSQASLLHSLQQTHGNVFQTNTFSMPVQTYANNLSMSYSNPTISTMNTNNNSSLNMSMTMDYPTTSSEYSYATLDREMEKVVEYIANLKYPEKREDALQELSKKRESFPNLAPYLWYSVGTVAIL